MYTFDTNTVIYYLDLEKDAFPVIKSIFSRGGIAFVPTIVEVELFSFKGLDDSDRNKIEGFLSEVFVINLDSKISRIAADIRCTTNIKTVDSVIAATAIYTKSTLVTRNVRDFKNIPNLQIQKI